MKFKQATDQLFSKVDHAELAADLGVSVASIRQARLDAGAKAYRHPPPKWRTAVVQLAERRLRHYEELLSKLQHDLNGEVN